MKLDLEDCPTPEHYRNWPGSRSLGSKMKVWKVQTRKFPDVDPGLVSNPMGFADSPDAEIISSGLNSKGPESVALGRHANFFLWGFSGAPSEMTPEARKAFLNSICYIEKFKGQQPLVRKTSISRDWVFLVIHYAMKDAKYAESILKPDGSFPEEVRKQFGKDLKKYEVYYRTNVEFLYPSNSGNKIRLAVDPDVHGLKLSNRKLELLDRCVTLLETDKELALRILKRYTTEDFSTPEGWKVWLEQNRSRIFFTDTGGFKFMVTPKDLIKSEVNAQAVPAETR